MKKIEGVFIEIIEMDKEPQYAGRRGEIEYIDDSGQLHGTWGGCVIIPSIDKFKIIVGNTKYENEIGGIHV